MTQPIYGSVFLTHLGIHDSLLTPQLSSVQSDAVASWGKINTIWILFWSILGCSLTQAPGMICMASTVSLSFPIEQNNIYGKLCILIFQQQPCAVNSLIFLCCSRLISVSSSGQSCSLSLPSDMPSLAMWSNGASLTRPIVKVRAAQRQKSGQTVSA